MPQWITAMGGEQEKAALEKRLGKMNVMKYEDVFPAGWRNRFQCLTQCNDFLANKDPRHDIMCACMQINVRCVCATRPWHYLSWFGG